MYLPADGSCRKKIYTKIKKHRSTGSYKLLRRRNYLEKRMHIRLRSHRLYRILRLCHIRAISIHFSRRYISTVALAIRRGAGVGVLWFHCLRTRGAAQFAVVARSRQFFFHVVHQSGQRRFGQLRRIWRTVRMRHESFHSCVRRYNVHPVVLSVQYVHDLQQCKLFYRWDTFGTMRNKPER